MEMEQAWKWNKRGDENMHLNGTGLEMEQVWKWNTDACLIACL